MVISEIEEIIPFETTKNRLPTALNVLDYNRGNPARVIFSITIISTSSDLQTIFIQNQQCFHVEQSSKQWLTAEHYYPNCCVLPLLITFGDSSNSSCMCPTADVSARLEPIKKQRVPYPGQCDVYSLKFSKLEHESTSKTYLE